MHYFAQVANGLCDRALVNPGALQRDPPSGRRVDELDAVLAYRDDVVVDKDMAGNPLTVDVGSIVALQI